MVEEGDGKKRKKPEYLEIAFWLKCFFSLMWIGFLIGMNHSNSGVLMKLFILSGSIAMVFYWFQYPYPFAFWSLWGFEDDEIKKDRVDDDERQRKDIRMDKN